MRAKLDENLPVEATELLRAAGWACDTVPDEGLGGAEDAKIGAACRAEARVLFTLDLDFSDTRAYPPNEYVGIVVFRPAEPIWTPPQPPAVPLPVTVWLTGGGNHSLSGAGTAGFGGVAYEAA